MTTDPEDQVDSTLVHRRQRAEFFKRAAIILLGVTILANAVMTAAAQAQLLSIAKVNRANSDLIIDCTTEGGDCYTRQQARLGAISGEPRGPINTVTVLVAVCAQQHATERAIVDCVSAHLEDK